MDNELIKWLNEERKKQDLTYRAFAEEVGISHTLVTNVLQAKSPISVDFCLKIAEYFNEPPIKLIIMGNIVPHKQELKRLILGYFKLPPNRQNELLKYIEYLYELEK